MNPTPDTQNPTPSSCEEKLAEYAEAFERLSKAALPAAEVISTVDGKATLLQSGQYHEVDNIGLLPGDTALTNPMTGQIVRKLDMPDVGVKATIMRAWDDKVEIAGPAGQSIIAHNATGVKADELSPGGSVIMSPSGMSAIYVIPKPAQKRTDTRPVSWDDIGGQEEAKHEVREAIEYPRKYAALWKHYNKRVTKGILLFGEPGCGKTLIGRALATAVGQQFLYVKGPEILDPYVGVSEANLRGVLKQAASGMLLFLDEADAVLGTRGARNSFMEKTLVPTFLTETDGIDEFHGTVVLATNRPDTIDPAVLRDGRIDRKIEVGRPALADIIQIFSIYLRRVPHESSDLAEYAGHLMWDDQFEMPDGKFLRDHASGALAEGIVDKAVSSAIRRDLVSMKKSKVGQEDIDTAVLASYRQNQFATAGR